jgi:pyridoxal phosphate enzyme (YggS family)
MSTTVPPSEPSNTDTTNHGDDAAGLDSTMKRIPIDPTRAATLASNMQHIRSRIAAVAGGSNKPRLVAVSKLKPASDVLALHRPPTAQLHFGENYVQELLEKSRLLPASVRWHFIGGLQSNKAAQLAREVEGLWAVESVDSEKKAALLDKGRGERNQRLRQKEAENERSEAPTEEKLRVFIQINTSGEESKSGVSPIVGESSEVVSLARFIVDQCPHLRLQGLMTIGAIARSKATTAETENEDFIRLRETRDRLAAALAVEPSTLELSMGMSEDFEGAIRQGSTEVRVGSTIFGERPPRKEAKVI